MTASAFSFQSIEEAPRLLIEARLEPVQGDRFQPTGFADLGAAEYEAPDGKRKLLVESAQSMANRLEATCLDGDGPHILSELEGLSYVVAKLTGQTETETSSLVEAHRLNSPFIISDDSFRKQFESMSGYTKGQVINWQKVARTLFHFDINSLIHGVFMANLGDGRVRLARSLSSFVEASDIREVNSGGVKNNPIDPTGKIRAANFDKDVYGNVPYHRTEYTAKKITAYFNLDLGQIRSFRLPSSGEQLLISLALFKIRKFLNSGLRLRTACIFDCKEIAVTAPDSLQLPSETDLLAEVQGLIAECKAENLFASPAVSIVETGVVLKDKKTDEKASV